MTADRAVPLGPRYWTGLSIASVFGATLGDVLSHDLRLGHWRGVLPLLLLAWLAVHGGRRGWLYRELAYWGAVVLVRAMATNIADLGAHDAHLRQPVLLATLAGAILAGAWLRPASAGGAAPPPGLPDTRGAYWILLFLAGVLGTVLGDDSSHRLGLVIASAALGTMLGLALLSRRLLRDVPMPGVVARTGYWATVAAARTAGTSVGDLIADHSGLGLAGSAAAEGLLMLGTLRAWPRR